MVHEIGHVFAVSRMVLVVGKLTILLVFLSIVLVYIFLLMADVLNQLISWRGNCLPASAHGQVGS